MSPDRFQRLIAMRGRAVLVFLAAVSCVNVDPQTGATLPRGNQRYKFEYVESRAGRLKKGMTALDCQMLLGSPAEKSADHTKWVYLPERPAILIPGRALELEFVDGLLADFGYYPIILGTRL